MKKTSLNFALTASGFAPSALPASALDEADLAEQMKLSERADWVLLRLVGCAALATLLLAAAITIAH
jgi:hypothetical protein